MPLDMILVQKQLKDLTDMLSDAQRIRRELTRYRSDLNSAWKGREMTYFNRTIDDLNSRISSLERQMESLRKNITLAADEILGEEAASAAASAGV